MPRHIGRTNIQYWVRKMSKSDLSVPDYFSRYKVPFSQAQYYRYKKKIAWEGIGSFQDKRTQGNRRAMTREADRKSTRLNSSHIPLSRMPSSA